MKIATKQDYEQAESEITRTEQDSIGDRVIRTRRILKDKGFTHYLYFGKPKELL